MGLFVSHGCWNRSYGSFMNWRHDVARAAGYAVWQVKYDSDGVTRPTIMLDWGHITNKNLYGHWDDRERPRDPLIILFAHHDDRGILTPGDADLIQHRLADVLPAMQEANKPCADAIYNTTMQFIKGLSDARVKWENVEFDGGCVQCPICRPKQDEP